MFFNSDLDIIRFSNAVAIIIILHIIKIVHFVLHRHLLGYLIL